MARESADERKKRLNRERVQRHRALQKSITAGNAEVTHYGNAAVTEIEHENGSETTQSSITNTEPRALVNGERLKRSPGVHIGGGQEGRALRNQAAEWARLWERRQEWLRDHPEHCWHCLKVHRAGNREMLDNGIEVEFVDLGLGVGHYTRRPTGYLSPEAKTRLKVGERMMVWAHWCVMQPDGLKVYPFGKLPS